LIRSVALKKRTSRICRWSWRFGVRLTDWPPTGVAIRVYPLYQQAWPRKGPGLHDCCR
jgi:hypothetical protein